MNAEQLLTHFDRISEAPDAIPRLRRFILDLAVRGKLVKQDQGDEPACELLKRIQMEKARLVKVGMIKESQPLTAIDSTKTPYEVPSNWEWVPLGETVISHLGGGTPSKSNSTYWNGDIFWASVKDVGKGKYVDETIDRITKAGLADSSSNLIPPGNLIVVTRMGLGKVSINRVPIAINQDLRALSLSGLSAIDYHYIFFKTHGFEGTGLTVKGIKLEELLNIAFPLPPFAEQQRIVAKVDELMALCDRLEVAQAKRENRRDRLVAAAHSSVSNSSFHIPHSAFLISHLPRLTTRPEHIQQLRQTILNLAVRGKLVPQDPSDEPASELLKVIRAEKTRQLKSGGLRKQEALSETAASDDLFGIPESWVWVRMDDCFHISGGIQKTPARTPKNNFYPYIGVGNVYRNRFDLSEVKQFELIEGELEKFCLLKGDILVVEGNGSASEIGRCAGWNGEVEDCVHQNHIIRCRPFNHELFPYVLKYLNSPFGIEAMKRLAVTSSGLYNLSVGKIRIVEIPLPPLAEQHRIVAKVDELTALCNRLEARLTITQSQSRRLLEATLAPE
jgi:type I restriction enzyme S subunit